MAGRDTPVRRVGERASVALLAVAGLADVAAHSVAALQAWELEAHVATFAGMTLTLLAVMDRGRARTRPRRKESRHAVR